MYSATPSSTAPPQLILAAVEDQLGLLNVQPGVLGSGGVAEYLFGNTPRPGGPAER
ncbi:hypothetical protein [Streptomyces sp. NBC_00996]|uniref:hypothetical protein n=1 Tax=Streptomyces sp. NBC_00996 TaxID=2903710 RepID=UPI00386963B0|nr:hypothetical protein OG390_09910 [Streptomyces sp. NBC_00996]